MKIPFLLMMASYLLVLSSKNKRVFFLISTNLREIEWERNSFHYNIIIMIGTTMWTYSSSVGKSDCTPFLLSLLTILVIELITHLAVQLFVMYSGLGFIELFQYAN
jgi:hypothetical protein